MKNKQVFRITMTALMAAMCYVGFSYIKFDIPVGPTWTTIHLGNTFCALAALLLGGVYGGAAGAIGMSIGDLLDPKYVLYAPRTIILKMLMGFIIGTVAHRVFKITKENTEKRSLKVYLSVASGMLVNIMIEPCINWLFYKFVLNAPEKVATAFAGVKFLSYTINAVFAIIIGGTIYLAVYSRMKNSTVFKDMLGEKY